MSLTANCWHEPDTEATETDGNQMPFIACLYHLCGSHQSWTLQGWHESLSLSLYCMCECVHVCVDRANVCVYVCFTGSYCHTMCWHSGKSCRSHLVCESSSPAADARVSDARNPAQTRTRTLMHTTVYLFIPFLTHACIYTYNLALTCALTRQLVGYGAQMHICTFTCNKERHTLQWVLPTRHI